MLLNLAPAHRTAMDKEGGRALSKYTKSLEKVLSNITPWRKRRGWARGLAKGKLEPGEVMVVLDEGDTPRDPLYKDANTTR
jgi:hypothetical protein